MTEHTHLTEQVQTENPFLVVSDGGPIQIIPTTHTEMIERIRTWQALTLADPSVDNVVTRDRVVMAEAAITLLEVDESTGISLEDFGPVGDMVSRVVGYAFGHDPRYTTVHWQVA